MEPTTVEAKIAQALKAQAALLSQIQQAHEQFQDPRSLSGKRWADLGSINQFNRLLGEALGFVHGCEGSQILAEVSK